MKSDGVTAGSSGVPVCACGGWGRHLHQLHVLIDTPSAPGYFAIEMLP